MGHVSPFQPFKFQDLFSDIKNSSIQWVLIPEIIFWRFKSPSRLQLPKWELTWECEGSFPHTLLHSPTLPGAWNVTHGLPSWLAPLQAFALVASPRLGFQHINYAKIFIVLMMRIFKELVCGWFFIICRRLVFVKCKDLESMIWLSLDNFRENSIYNCFISKV